MTTTVTAPRRWPDGTGAIAPLARILVVGHPVEAGGFGKALATQGHDAVVVHNGQAALSVVRQWPPDFAFVDVDAPIGDLPRFARRIRETSGCELTHVVAVTERRARYPGFSAHILKPLSLETTEQLIATLRLG